MGDKHNDIVIVNAKNNKKTLKDIYTDHVRADSLYTYLHTYTN